MCVYVCVCVYIYIYIYIITPHPEQPQVSAEHRRALEGNAFFFPELVCKHEDWSIFERLRKEKPPTHPPPHGLLAWNVANVIV